MRSMTGFGRGEASRDGVHVTAEVRALNQRFLEVKLNLPRGWGEYESEVRKAVQTVVARGRIEVTIRRTALKPRAARLIVNDELARRYIAELRRLQKGLKLKGEPGIEAVLQRAELFQVVEEEDEKAGGDLKLARSALGAALKALDAERQREGGALKKDLTGYLKRIDGDIEKISRLAAESRAAIVATFEDKIRELLREQPLDERRLYDEAAGAAQRADISEELARLRTHLHGLGELFERANPVGKEIEFLLQEINREVNTIGSKSQNAALSRAAVDIKGALEKMREQVQNVE